MNKTLHSSEYYLQFVNLVRGNRLESSCLKSLDKALANEQLRKYDIQPWWFEKVREYRHSLLNGYEDKGFVDMDVDVFKIFGTDHWSYTGRTWIEMLRDLKDKHNFDVLDVEDLRAKSKNWHIVDRIHLIKIEDDFYICGGGNHRVCLSRFFGISPIHAEVSIYEKKKQTHPESITCHTDATPARTTFLQRLIKRLKY